MLAALRGHTHDSVALVPVCSNGVLLGVVTVERLLGAAPGASVEEVIDAQPPTVTLGTDQEHAAWQAVQNDEAALGRCRRGRAADVAAAVAVALFAASSVATSIAMLPSSAVHRLGRDPAFGSGPLATVAQDLLSIVIYFLAATALVA